jgi:hypothetical protein
MHRLSLRLLSLSAGLLASLHALPASGPEPGLWEVSADMAIPTAPDFKQEPVTLRQCFSAADVRDPSRMLGGMTNAGAANCRFSDKRESPGHVDFAVRCDGLLEIAGRGSVDYTARTLQGRLDLGFAVSAGENAQRVESVSHVSAKRIGNCP